jgi:hypothetical protein
MRFSHWILVFAFMASSATAHITYTGRSGAPGRQTCASSCHGIGTGNVVLSGFPATYTPSQTYLITIERTAGAAIANFNGSCRIGTGTNNAGVITAGTGTSTYNVTGETNGIHMTTGNLNSATFNWTAPTAGTGSVTLYVGAHQDNIADGPNNAFLIVSDEAAVAPAAPDDVVISFSAADGMLNWSSVVGAATYNVYRDSVSSIQPLPANLIGTTADTSYVDVGAANLPNVHQFYVVTAVAP